MRGNHSDIEIGSDRNFGVVMAVAFALLGGISFWRDSGAWPYLWGVSAVFAVPTVLAPHILHPANRLWHAFGLLLGRIVAPVVMAVMFFVVVTPIALVARFFGNDPLRLKMEPRSGSYWIRRDPPGPDPQSMRNQF